MKKSVLYALCIATAIIMTACGNTQTTPSSSASNASMVAPTSSVAEVKDDYVAIGGLTPYEVLTATEEATIKKAEEEARVRAEAAAKAQAEAKAKAEQQPVEQVTEQPQPAQEQDNGLNLTVEQQKWKDLLLKIGRVEMEEFARTCAEKGLPFDKEVSWQQYIAWTNHMVQDEVAVRSYLTNNGYAMP